MHSDTPALELLRDQTRRHFFSQCGVGLGAMALGSMLGDRLAAAPATAVGVNPLAPKPTHFPPKVKRVIYLRSNDPDEPEVSVEFSVKIQKP